MTTSYAFLDRKSKRESNLGPLREYSVELGLRTHRPSAITSTLEPLLTTHPSSPSYDNYNGRSSFRSTTVTGSDHKTKLSSIDTLSGCSTQPQYGDLSDWWDLPSYSANGNYEQKTKNVRISYSADEIYGRANLNHQDIKTDKRKSNSKKSESKLAETAHSFHANTRTFSQGENPSPPQYNSIKPERDNTLNFQYAFGPMRDRKFTADQHLPSNSGLHDFDKDSTVQQRSIADANDAIKYRTFEEAMHSYPNEDTDDSDAAIEAIIPSSATQSANRLINFDEFFFEKSELPSPSLTSEREHSIPDSSKADILVEERAVDKSPKEAWVSVEEVKLQPEVDKTENDDYGVLAKLQLPTAGSSFDREPSRYSPPSPDNIDRSSSASPSISTDRTKADVSPVQTDQVTINQSPVRSRKLPTKANRSQVEPKSVKSAKSVSLEADKSHKSKVAFPDGSQKKPAASSKCEVPPIDLGQLSPRRTKSAKPARKSVSKSTSIPKSRTLVQVQVNSPKAQQASSAYTPKAGEFKNKKDIVREIKMRVQKKPVEIAGEIKRRVQQKAREGPKEESTLKSGEYIKVDEQQLTTRSYLTLNSFRGYDRYNEMSPRIEAGEISRWQCLPEELWLLILSFLSRCDLHSFMLTGSDFNRLSHDRSLWKDVTISRKQLSDGEIIKLGYLHPRRLSVVQCTGIKVNGDMVSNRGLREMFSSCGKDLKHLSAASCVMPPLSGEAMLHHAVVHCPNIQSLDISWCNLTNRDVELVAENFSNLRLLCLNGNQAITDIAMTKLFRSLWNQLEQLEIQGCFKLTNQSLQEIGQCVNLHTLNIGQCHKFSSSHIMSEVSRLLYLEVCNLKGLKQVKDSCITGIIKSCPSIQHLVIAQCSALTPKSLIEISCGLSSLSILDVSSCKDCVNDASICAMLANCGKLTSLDLSSTPVTNQSITALIDYCKQLGELRLNFCSVTDGSIKELLTLTSLKKLFLYGVKGIQLEELSDINSTVCIEN